MSTKFKKGDRVRVTEVRPWDSYCGVKVGAIGTILEDDEAPWIRMDRPLNIKLEGAPCDPGHGKVMCQENLERIPPDPMASISAHPAINETADDVLVAAWAKSALDGLPKLPILRTPEAEARFVAAFAGVRRALEALAP